MVEQREIAGVSLLRLALDPVAEHLAAIDMVNQLGKDSAAWQAALAALQQTKGYPETISGFLNALGDCYRTYRQPFDLPDLVLPWDETDTDRAAA